MSIINNSDKLNILSDFYEALNSDKYNSFYKLNIELKQELQNIISEKNNSENIRSAAILENGILYLNYALDDLNNFDMEKFLFYNKINIDLTQYFENRTKEVNNTFILARYNHVLWLTKKHNNYALEAIKNYLLAKDILTEQRENENIDFDLLECLKRAFYIKCKIKDNNNFNIEKEIINVILKNIDYDYGVNICVRLLEIIHYSYKYFKNILYQDFFNQINIFVNKLLQNKEASKAIRILELIIKIVEKIKFDATSMYENLGSANEILIYEFNKSIVSVHYCLEALRIYSKLKNNTKVEELKRIYEEISNNLKFSEIKTKIDIKPMIDDAELLVKKLNKMSINDILSFFIHNKHFIPSKDFIKTHALRKERGLLSLIGGNYDVFDLRGNLVKVCSTDEEKNWHKMMEMYGFVMQIQSRCINLVIIDLIESKKLTFGIILDDLLNNTWFTSIFKISYSNGDEIKYTYSNIIITLLNKYFQLINKYLINKEINNTDFLMFIDSTTLKFEGLFRELFTLNGFPTIISDNNTGTAHEKDLNALLHDENIKKIFDEDELIFFKYLFIEQNGLNLRNKVAHSLLLEQDYNLGIANLLFFALLRLFKFYVKYTKE